MSSSSYFYFENFTNIYCPNRKHSKAHLDGFEQYEENIIEHLYGFEQDDIFPILLAVCFLFV